MPPLSQSPVFDALRSAARERILVLDGAMGTVIHGHKFTEGDFRGSRFVEWSRDLRGNNDLLNLTQPEAIRELVCAHAGLPQDPRANEIVDEAARRARLRPVLDDLHTRYEPEATGIDAALGRIVGAIHTAIAEGTWHRLKACERDVCRWAFYDHSKNRSGHWCSMAVCGNRMKARRHYERTRPAPARAD